MMNYSSTLNPSFWLHFWFILFRENVQILAEKTYWNTYWKEYQREMATTGLQLLGFILGVFAWAGMIATCASPEWRKNSVGGTALDQHKRYFFPWKICFLHEKSGLMVCGFNANKCRTEIPIAKVTMFSSSGFQVKFFTRLYWNRSRIDF